MPRFVARVYWPSIRPVEVAALRTTALGMMLGVPRRATPADSALVHCCWMGQKAREELVVTGRKNCYLQGNRLRPANGTVVPPRKMLPPQPKVVEMVAIPVDRPAVVSLC